MLGSGLGVAFSVAIKMFPKLIVLLILRKNPEFARIQHGLTRLETPRVLLVLSMLFGKAKLGLPSKQLQAAVDLPFTPALNC